MTVIATYIEENRFPYVLFYSTILAILSLAIVGMVSSQV
jgi:VIT1/CCC1 family predicted Fe2+/Mn2+ transporter